MARIQYWQYLLDRQGRPLQDASVRVYLAGTLNEADIYLNATFGSIAKSSVIDLKTDKYGFIQFWVGDRWEVRGGYNETQQFKIVWENTVDSIQETIDNLYIFTPVRPIDVSDAIKGNTSNRDKDKVISNAQGYNWDTHTDSIVPLDNPHGIAPVTFFDLGTLQSKVISNKLGYQMYTLSNTASATPVDVSGAGVYETVSSWTLSGGYYYQDVTHNLSNFYPIVILSKASDGYQLVPMEVQSMNENIVRIWVEEDISSDILVLG